MVRRVSLPLPQYSLCLGCYCLSSLVSQLCSPRTPRAPACSNEAHLLPLCLGRQELLEGRVGSCRMCVVVSRSPLSACYGTGSNNLGERLRHRNHMHAAHSTWHLHVFPSTRQSAPWVRKQTWPASCQVPSQLMTSIMSFETHNDPVKERQQVSYLCFIIRQWTPAGTGVHIPESQSTVQGYKLEEQTYIYVNGSLLGTSAMRNLSVNMQILARWVRDSAQQCEFQRVLYF